MLCADTIGMVERMSPLVPLEIFRSLLLCYVVRGRTNLELK